MAKNILTTSAILLSVLALLYLMAMLALYCLQEKLIFPGQKLPKNYTFSFDQNFSEITIPVQGAQLNALHFKQQNSRGLVFFLHGNGGNLQNWTSGVDFYQQENYDLFIFDYRGYGKSTGLISSEAQLMDDVRAAWRTVAPQYTGKPIVIYGRSLGTALAVQLATEVSVEKVILVSPFSSMKAIAKEKYPLVPSWLLRYPLQTDAIISQINTDIIFMHGTDDRFIDSKHSRQLQKLTKHPSELITLEGAQHNDIHLHTHYLKKLADLLPD